jgi:dynein heavy chain 2
MLSSSCLQDEVASWETRLSTLVEGLGLLQGIQRRWLYLGPIFGRGALPAVAGRFRHVDGEFRAIMAQLAVSDKSQFDQPWTISGTAKV